MILKILLTNNNLNAQNKEIYYLCHPIKMLKMQENLVEWVGYAAMISLMISFMMKDMKRLRVINTVGCILFVIYGFMLHSWPIIITNAFISAVNLYYLFVKKTA